MWLLKRSLSDRIRVGSLTIHDADGGQHRFFGSEDGPQVTIRLHDKTLPRRLVLNPGLALGEAYMDGTLTFEDGSGIDDYIALFGANRASLSQQPANVALRAVGDRLKRVQQFNPVGRAARNASHHYELKEELFRLFLDEGMQYSCAYWDAPGEETLEEAQERKLRHLAAKLRLEPGMKVLEIGSGWGTLAIYLARQFGVHVTAANVAEDQLAASRRRVDEAGMSDRITFVKSDWRDLDGTFDRVVAVEMLEHVGAPHLPAYFRKVHDLLAPAGSAVIVSAGRMTPPGSTGPFVRKYIFPGGYAPALSEVLAAAELAGVWVCDLEFLRYHYAWTLKEWLRRFRSNRDEVVALYDERFFRMWEFYLRGTEEYFLSGNNVVFQIQVARERTALPPTRDYMWEDERRLEKEQASVAPPEPASARGS